MAGKRKKRDEPAAVAANGETAEESRNVDEVLDGLERIVRDLEAGDLPLEKALAKFEEGVRFARRGSELLSAVEERVEMLLADREEAVPFEREEDGGSDDDEV
jgi:exodeoxyribonuclease VII small subunit